MSESRNMQRTGHKMLQKYSKSTYEYFVIKVILKKILKSMSSFFLLQVTRCSGSMPSNNLSHAWRCWEMKTLDEQRFHTRLNMIRETHHRVLNHKQRPRLGFFTSSSWLITNTNRLMDECLEPESNMKIGLESARPTFNELLTIFMDKSTFSNWYFVFYKQFLCLQNNI